MSKENPTPRERLEQYHASALSERDSTVEALSDHERQRRAQADHGFNLSRSISDGLHVILTDRAVKGDLLAQRMGKDLEILESGLITNPVAVDEQGKGFTQRCTLSKDGQERIGFLKWQRGEPAVMSTPDGIAKVVRSLQEDGQLASQQKLLYGQNARDYQILIQHREEEHSELLKQLSDSYGIPPEKIPLRTDVIGIKRIDVGHTTRADIATSVLSTAIGFEEIPVTALHMDRHELGSVQKKASGDCFGVDVLLSLYEQGARHPAAPSLARLASLDFFSKGSDRHPLNTFFDEVTHQFFGIDNSYSNGYSVPNTEASADTHPALQRMPADSYASVPLEIMNDLPDIQLLEADKKALRRVVDDVTNYMRYTAGQLNEAEISQLPDAVKEGRLAKTLSDTFRMLYERVDASGQVSPESTAIAKQELHDFIARVDYVAIHGRPPQLSAKHLNRFGLKLTVDMHRARQSAGMKQAA